MKTVKKALTHAELVAAAPKGERWIPLNQDGTLLHDREGGTTGFASVTPAGRANFRRMYRAMARRALAARSSRLEADAERKAGGR